MRHLVLNLDYLDNTIQFNIVLKKVEDDIVQGMDKLWFNRMEKGCHRIMSWNMMHYMWKLNMFYNTRNGAAFRLSQNWNQKRLKTNSIIQIVKTNSLEDRLGNQKSGLYCTNKRSHDPTQSMNQMWIITQAARIEVVRQVRGMFNLLKQRIPISLKNFIGTHKCLQQL